MKTYDYVIVGAGLFGATFAHLMMKAGRSCLVIDKRSSVGGNCHTYNQDGIQVHAYGPHIFHTSNKEVWKFVNSLCEFNSFTLRVKNRVGDKLYSFPINLMTMYQLWGVTTPEEARKKMEEVRIPRKTQNNVEDWCLANIGEEMYELFIYHLTKKQWFQNPKEIPAFVVQRLPVRFDFNDRYLKDEYEGVPTQGYTHLVQCMLGNTPLLLNTDYFNNRDTYHKLARRRLIFCGRIDEFFNFSLGRLDYRGLQFEHKTLECADFQGTATINYSGPEVPWKRIIEHKHFDPFNAVFLPFTIITRETAVRWEEGMEPYYPVFNEGNIELFKAYKNLGFQQTPDTLFAGRLGEYHYYDMDKVIARAFEVVKQELCK